MFRMNDIFAMSAQYDRVSVVIKWLPEMILALLIQQVTKLVTKDRLQGKNSGPFFSVFGRSAPPLRHDTWHAFHTPPRCTDNCLPGGIDIGVRTACGDLEEPGYIWRTLKWRHQSCVRLSGAGPNRLYREKQNENCIRNSCFAEHFKNASLHFS